jgi:hypothetical protein
MSSCRRSSGFLVIRMVTAPILTDCQSVIFMCGIIFIVFDEKIKKREKLNKNC